MPALDYDAFRRSLLKGELLTAYYLHGDEDFLKDEAIRELLSLALEDATREFNLDSRRVGELTPDQFATLTLTPPMLAARRAVLLSEVEALQQKRPRMQGLRAAVVDYLSRPNPDTLLILTQSSGAKPDPELSRHAATVDFRALEPQRVLRWIHHRAKQEGLELDEAAARHLHESVGDSLALLAAELAKLRTAVPERAVGVGDVVDLVGVRRGETLHDFTDAVTARRFPQALGMVAHLLELPGISGVRLVSTLATALTGVALARSMMDAGAGRGAVERRLFEAIQSARPMGLRSWREEASRWAESAAHWSAAQLEDALGELLKADRRLKSASLGGEAELVTDALLAMAGRARAAA